jgi:hypothetical protein
MTRNDRDPNTLDFDTHDLTHHPVIIPPHDPTILPPHDPKFLPLPHNPNVVETAGQSM